MKRGKNHDDLRDRDLQKRFTSLARVKAPGRALDGIYRSIDRLSEEAGRLEHPPVIEESLRPAGPWGFAARFLAALTPARAALLASFLTLCIAVPATFFLSRNTSRGKTSPDKIYIVRLVYENQNAATIAVIGDFNNWQKDATEMRRIPGTSLWATEIPLPEGLYRYAFLIDEREWKADPLARVTIKDDFGKDNSLIVLVNQKEEARL